MYRNKHIPGWVRACRPERAAQSTPDLRLPPDTRNVDGQMSILDLFRDRNRRFLLLTASLTFLAMGISQAMYGPFYPHFRSEFGLSGSAVGLLASFHFTGTTAAVFLAGFVVRRIGYKTVIVSGAMLFSAGFFGIAASSDWIIILAATLLLGLGFGVLISYNLMVDDYFGPLGPAAINLINVFFGIGSVLGPLLAGASISVGGHRIGFLAGGAIATVILLMALRLPQHHPVAETDRTGAGFALAGTGVFLLLFSLYVGAEVTSSSWIPTSLARNHPAPAVATFTATFWLALSAGRLIAVPLSIRLAPSRMVIGALSCAAVAVLLARVESIAPPAYILTGFFIGPVFPAAVSWIRRVFPTRAARITSVVLAGGGTGGIVFPPLVGVTVDFFTSAIIPVMIAMILVLAIAVAGAIARFFPLHETRGTGQKEADSIG